MSFLQKRRSKLKTAKRQSSGDTFNSPTGPLIFIIFVGIILLAVAENYNQNLCVQVENSELEKIK